MSEQGSQAWNFETTIPSDTAIGSALINDLVAAMESFGWQSDHVFRVQLAYEEAIVNAIRHGNKFAEDKTVDVRMHCDNAQVQIVIEDMGPGFDPDELPDPRDEERLEIPGGRGVMLIRELMTEVEYNELGNRVTMRKLREQVTKSMFPEEEDEQDAE
ncbi:ATP-binding protein [Planctomycetaceae bacterium SH139]